VPFGIVEQNPEAPTLGAQPVRRSRPHVGVADLRAYLTARVRGDWLAACEAASAQYKRQLDQAVKDAKGNEAPKGCAKTLAQLFGRTPKQTLSEATQI